MKGIKYYLRLGTIDAQQIHKLIISKYPHDDIIQAESSNMEQIQKRSLVNEDLGKPDDKTTTTTAPDIKPVVNLTTVSDNKTVTATVKADENFHITVDSSEQNSDDDVSKPREITLYLAGRIFFFIK